MGKYLIVLVDQHDTALGGMEKMEVHLKGMLHRAFSVFIFNSKNEMLIHQRAETKYHGGGLWTNACCSYPLWNDDIKASAMNRLQFEMGICCDIKKAFIFTYHTPVEYGLIEHEYDHVFIGVTDEEPKHELEEVQDYKWMKASALQEDILTNPQLYTYWFRIAFPRTMAFFTKSKK